MAPEQVCPIALGVGPLGSAERRPWLRRLPAINEDVESVIPDAQRTSHRLRRASEHDGQSIEPSTVSTADRPRNRRHRRRRRVLPADALH